jgi:exodeoxyribonuclease VII small subunit
VNPEIDRYEAYLKELEAGIAALEKGSLSLSDSLKQHQRCQELSRITDQILTEAERASTTAPVSPPAMATPSSVSSDSTDVPF